MVLLVGGMFAMAIGSTQASPAQGVAQGHSAQKHVAKAALQVSNGTVTGISVGPCVTVNQDGSLTISGTVTGSGTVTLELYYHIPPSKGGSSKFQPTGITTIVDIGSSGSAPFSIGPFPAIPNANSYRVQVFSTNSQHLPKSQSI